jgi:glucokinase
MMMMKHVSFVLAAVIASTFASPVWDKDLIGHGQKFVIKSPGGRCAHLANEGNVVAIGYETGNDVELCKQADRQFVISDRSFLVLNGQALTTKYQALIKKDEVVAGQGEKIVVQFALSKDGLKKQLHVLGTDNKCISNFGGPLTVDSCDQNSGLVFQRV